jgi:hypothetical protein
MLDKQCTHEASTNGMQSRHLNRGLHKPTAVRASAKPLHGMQLMFRMVCMMQLQCNK